MCVACARARSTLFALSRGLDFPQAVAVLVNHAFLAALANLEKRARELALQAAVSFSMNCEVKFHGLTFGKTPLHPMYRATRIRYGFDFRLA